MTLMPARAAVRISAAGALDGLKNTMPEQTNNINNVSTAFMTAKSIYVV